MSVTRINKFEAKEGLDEQLYAFLISIVPLIECSRGCVSCQLLRSEGNTGEFVIIEVWDSVESHQASVKNIPAEKLGAVMPLLAKPPSGAYYVA